MVKNYKGWTEKEDRLLVEIILSFIQEGKTQTEAFKLAGDHLGRTAGACGYRWNAKLRKQYKHELQEAKQGKYDRKISNKLKERMFNMKANSIDEVLHILLTKLKEFTEQEKTETKELKLRRLINENERLRRKIDRYEEAWQEMNHLWRWIKNKEAGT